MYLSRVIIWGEGFEDAMPAAWEGGKSSPPYANGLTPLPRRTNLVIRFMSAN